MRKLVVFNHVSLDGYFEGPGHDISWATAQFDAPVSDADGPANTILMGRRTYELMKSYWPTPEALAGDPAIARYMNETRKVVASHTPFDPGWQNVTIISDDITGRVRALKDEPGAGIIIFGSNTLCVSLMEAGLIDELMIIVNPVLLGAGTPIFQGLQRPVPLTLTDTRTVPPGAVVLTYTPAARA